MTDPKPVMLSTSYATTHCRNCAAGWTRRTADGGIKTVCLLDREAVLVGLVECDRYQPRPPA